MGSLNGDVMVMRNGRSTSQVSVYNYPEHLNPFYEDDQHKRLRFWKISKKDNEGRRNSFSIANLKDMWAFKSFRMKKKSSTLGINKTSESPPLLRRDYALDNGWNTFDNRLRGNNTTSMNGDDSFQRNATYRSSLQTLPINNDRMGLNRNDGYRSTIQVTRSNPRYQPQQKQHFLSNSGVSQNRRSSQSSMVSTNPFESDDDENEEFKAGMRSILNGSITTLTSRTPRKKRRAPAPPSPLHGSSNGAALPTIRIDSSQDNSQDKLHIKEDMDIANLTAEIESFVKTKSSDDVEESRQESAKTTKPTTVDNSKVEEERQPTHVTTPTNTNITEDSISLPKETIKTAEIAINDEVATETDSQLANTNIKKSAVIKPEENATKLARVSTEIEVKMEESNDIKTNGAIPKKPNNNHYASGQQQQICPNVSELCIRETCAEEMASKPIPLKRQTKPDVEVGQVECIHVHVESPKASPRKDHSSDLTSFKATETVEATDAITTKTPFVLTSPPIQRRNQQPVDSVEPIKKETVKIIDTPNTKSTLANELNIQEECNSTKPEILAKPILSPKPVTKETNGKMQSYADIHKPTRRHNQNGQLVKTLREGSISPPSVPQHITNKEEEKINNTDQCRTNGFVEEKSAAVQFEQLDSLKIIESPTTKKSNDDFKKAQEDEKYRKEFANNNCVAVSSSAVRQKELKRDDVEIDALYRPKPTSHMEWKCSTLAPLETNIPPEKRKSVKDIIESINRSQRLLNAAANKDFPALQYQKYHQPSLNVNNNLNEDLRMFNEQQEEVQCSNEKVTPSPHTTDQAQAGAASSPSPSPSNDYNDNNEIFQKCKVNKEVFDYRETSPITSNLDWNPVPKPKRTKAAQE